MERENGLIFPTDPTANRKEEVSERNKAVRRDGRINGNNLRPWVY